MTMHSYYFHKFIDTHRAEYTYPNTGNYRSGCAGQLLDGFQRALYVDVLQRTQNKSRAALALSINRNTLRSKIKQMKIKESEWKNEVSS